MWQLSLCAVLAALPSYALAAAKDAAGKVQEFLLEGTRWRMIFSEERGAFYFYNTASGTTQWTDPRRAASSSETFTTFLVFLLPFLLLVAAGGAYLTYIRIVHPDVLKPPKKAKGKYVHSLAKAAKKVKANGGAASPVDEKKNS